MLLFILCHIDWWSSPFRIISLDEVYPFGSLSHTLEPFLMWNMPYVQERNTSPWIISYIFFHVFYKDVKHLPTGFPVVQTSMATIKLFTSLSLLSLAYFKNLKSKQLSYLVLYRMPCFPFQCFNYYPTWRWGFQNTLVYTITFPFIEVLGVIE